MKSTIFTVLFTISALLAIAQGYNQNTHPLNRSLPYPNPYDTTLNPDLCDTLNYIFRAVANDFSSLKYHGGTEVMPSDTPPANARISYTRIPGSYNDNIITGSPFVFFCPYRSGTDSVSMYNVFTSLISGVGDCLLKGPVQKLNIYYTRATDDPATIRYSYLIKDLKPDADPALARSTVTIEFRPDKSGINGDAMKMYRVNIIIRP